MSKIHIRRETGEEIYWTDPDTLGEPCSGYGVLVDYIDDEIALIKKDGEIIEVYISELS